PFWAASAARSRPSRAFSPRYSRVSRPVTGAYNNATAAPLTAPSRNASNTLPAPVPSSLAIGSSFLLLAGPHPRSPGTDFAVPRPRAETLGLGVRLWGPTPALRHGLRCPSASSVDSRPRVKLLGPYRRSWLRLPLARHPPNPSSSQALCSRRY